MQVFSAVFVLCTIHCFVPVSTAGPGQASEPHRRQKRFLLFEKGAKFVIQCSCAKAVISEKPSGLNEISEYTVTYDLPHSLHRWHDEGGVAVVSTPQPSTTAKPWPYWQVTADYSYASYLPRVVVAGGGRNASAAIGDQTWQRRRHQQQQQQQQQQRYQQTQTIIDWKPKVSESLHTPLPVPFPSPFGSLTTKPQPQPMPTLKRKKLVWCYRENVYKNFHKGLQFKDVVCKPAEGVAVRRNTTRRRDRAAAEQTDGWQPAGLSEGLLFDLLVQWAEMHGYNGRHCFMRTLCESRHLLLPHGHSLFHDMVRILVSNALPAVRRHRVYGGALDRSNFEDCARLYGPHCRVSFLEHFTQAIHTSFM